MRTVIIIGLALAAAALAGCAGKKGQTSEQYFTTANDSFRTGALDMAIEQFNELLDQHPFSEHSEEAELRIAHAYYLAGSYPEAVVALTDFQRRHPTSPNLPFVGYYLGMCYLRQMNTLDRDQTAARNAHTYFLTVSRQYPDSPFAELARERLAECRDRLAAHDLYVANFYRRRENFRAAEVRMLTLASRYQETPAAAEALIELGNYYGSQKRPEQAALAYLALIDAQPTSPELPRAEEELAKLPADLPATGGGDPLGALLAANGRQRSTLDIEPIRMPDLSAKPPRPGLAGAGSPGGFGQGGGPFGGGGSPFGRGGAY
ncbi:outer membrane protein assembly factor BamD [Candidatus Binatia bacterium]|nr:outer membrane protein assembly factor BamD [Candidatus Binatia bacterium]